MPANKPGHAQQMQHEPRQVPAAQQYTNILPIIPSMFHAVLCQTADVFNSPARHHGRSIIYTNAQLGSSVPALHDRFHYALDALEADIMAAKMVIHRDYRRRVAEREKAEAAEAGRLEEGNKEREEAEKAAREEAEKAEKAEREKVDQEQAEKERLNREKAQQHKLDWERANREKERKQKEKAEKEKTDKEAEAAVAGGIAVQQQLHIQQQLHQQQLQQQHHQLQLHQLQQQQQQQQQQFHQQQLQRQQMQMQQQQQQSTHAFPTFMPVVPQQQFGKGQGVTAATGSSEPQKVNGEAQGGGNKEGAGGSVDEEMLDMSYGPFY